jgi:hypothetical protein
MVVRALPTASITSRNGEAAESDVVHDHIRLRQHQIGAITRIRSRIGARHVKHAGTTDARRDCGPLVVRQPTLEPAHLPYDNNKSLLCAVRRTKINSSDPPLMAIFAPHPAQPLLALFDPPIEPASSRPRGHFHLDGRIDFAAISGG